MNGTLTIAVSKGRILEESLPLLARAGIVPEEDPARSRRLIIPAGRPGVRLVIIRAADVPTFVEHGTAELGIAGKDVLLEHEGDGIYEPLDLHIAACRMMLAGPSEATPPRGRLRVATKYVRTTRNYFAAMGQQVEIIRLYGSMEIAPVLGLADRIVDLVDTGNTLKANGLEPLDLVANITSRLIVNKAALKLKHEVISPLLAQLAEAVRKRA